MLSDKQVILVVENDLITCLNVAELLDDNNYVCFTATSIEEALKILNVSDNIDLLITDMDLGNPNFGGLDLSKTFRKMFKSLPVIFVTGSVKTVEGFKGSKFLRKPYENESLITNIQEMLLAVTPQ